MSALGVALKDRWNPLGAVFVLILAVALGISIVAFDKLAVAGLFGLIGFCFFLRFPVLGLYATVILLLLSGTGGVIGAGGIHVAVPLTLAKLCGAAALAAWALNLLSRRQSWHFGWEVILAIIFLIWSLASAVFSDNRAEQLPEWIRLGTLVGFFVMGVDLLSGGETAKKRLRAYIVIICLCVFLSAASAVAQYFMPSTYIEGLDGRATFQETGGAIVDPESLAGEAAIRVSGRAQHSNWLAFTLLCVLPLNAFWFTVSKRKIFKTFVVAATLIELAALILTFTRTGFLVGVIVVVLLALKQQIKSSPYRFVGLALAAVLGWMILPGPYKERVLTFRQYTGSKSVQTRAQLQAAAWEYMTEHPIKGIGLGGFGFRMMEEPNEAGRIMKIVVDHYAWNPLFIGVHNLYLQIGCETGLIGLAIFLAFIVLLMRHVHLAEQRFKADGDDEWRTLAATLQVSLVAFLISGIFLHALQQKVWWLIAAGAMGLCLIAADAEHREKDVKPAQA